MNPLTNMKNVLKLSEQELHTGNKTSWHDQYKDSAWVFVAGFPYQLSEGDLIAVFSQYGEIVHINLVRDKDTGKSRGFCFICYEDQRSTVLAVDNFNGIKILNRILRVDHVSNYKVPKNAREEAAKVMPPPAPAAPVVKAETPLLTDVRETLADQIVGDIKLPPRLPIYPIKEENKSSTEKVKVKKDKKSKKEKKHKKKKKKAKKRKRVSNSDSSSDDTSSEDSDDSDNKKRRKAK